jgi:hypothetical protein
VPFFLAGGKGMAKVKLIEPMGRWRLEGRTVLHQSWAGVTWRRKASALPYTEDCRFKPTLPTHWTVKLYIDGGNIGSRDANIRLYVVRAVGDTIEQHFEIRDSQYLLGYSVSVEVLFVAFSHDQLTKVWRWWYYDFETGDLVFEDIHLVVPPFNGQPPNVDQWVDEQSHTF